MNEPWIWLRVNDPPKTWVETEHVISTVWPQVTSPTGQMEIRGFGNLTEKISTYQSIISPGYWFYYWKKRMKQTTWQSGFFFLPVSLTGEELNLRLIFMYWHWYSPSWSKFTLWRLNVTELIEDVWLWLNEPEVFWRIKVPPENLSETEQLILTSWPQVTSLLYKEMVGSGRVSKEMIQY